MGALVGSGPLSVVGALELSMSYGNPVLMFRGIDIHVYEVQAAD